MTPTPRSTVKTFVQARMSSSRFPGKVLAPLNGKPVLAHLIDRLKAGVPVEAIVVATSDHRSDDPLAVYAATLGVQVFRGPLDNVFERFRLCLERYPCDWFYRISADSPLMDGSLLARLAEKADKDVDLVTNVFPRSFPKGHSAELLNSERFARLDPVLLSAEEQEHLTKVYYNHPGRFRIVNIPSGDPSRATINYCVDTLEDLRRLEATEVESR
jgi:spore coat polysaccharide biosynthesis protein SpsF (cytidylyltransferase family)